MFTQEHEPLVESATHVLDDLHSFPNRLVRVRVHHHQHDVFAERALSLELYLSSALRLCVEDQYLAAFAVLRAALEHHLTDRLLFVGRRYKSVYTRVTKADFEQLESDVQAKEARHRGHRQAHMEEW
jgi:hypothetical protein